MVVGTGNAQEAVIPRFYFPLRCAHEGVSPDEFGLDLPDAESAYLEADRAVRDMAREFRAKGQDPRSYAFEITDASGEVLFELPFAETLDREEGSTSGPPAADGRGCGEPGREDDAPCR